jgi:hypothetical protein
MGCSEQNGPEPANPDGSGVLYVSTNAATWVQVLATPQGRSTVNCAGGLFFATGDYRAVFVSPDGYQWTKYAISPY